MIRIGAKRKYARTATGRPKKRARMSASEMAGCLTMLASGRSALANCVLPIPDLPQRNKTRQSSGMTGAWTNSVKLRHGAR